MIERIYRNSAEQGTENGGRKNLSSQIADGIILDARERLTDKQVFRMPIAQLTSLGTGVSSLIPAFRTITQTTAVNVDGLYRLANASVGDTLKLAKNGNFWGAFKTAEGSSKFAQLQAAGTAPATMTTVMPLNPAMIMIAATLYSINQNLDSIAEIERQILSFLQTEKESEIEADMETLYSMLCKYKMNWDNEHFITSNHKLAIDIQRTARKNLISYQKEVADVLVSKKTVASQAKVNAMLKSLMRKFRYYRLSLYIFAMASFTEIILSGDFKEENLLAAKTELEKMSGVYRDLFEKCSVYLERMSNNALEANVLRGVGAVSNSVGKAIEAIPVIRKGPVDEFLQGRGKQMQQSAAHIERQIVESFAEMSNPGIGAFTEKMQDMIRIYGHTSEICFDQQNIYLVVG